MFRISYKTIVFIAIAFLLVVHFDLPSFAHKMTVTAQVEYGAHVTGSARYHTTPVAEGIVKVIAPDDKVLLQTTTDKDGRFVFDAKYKCDLVILVNDGGHRGKAVVKAEDLPDDLPPYKPEK